MRRWLYSVYECSVYDIGKKLEERIRGVVSADSFAEAIIHLDRSYGSDFYLINYEI